MIYEVFIFTSDIGYESFAGKVMHVIYNIYMPYVGR